MRSRWLSGVLAIFMLVSSSGCAALLVGAAAGAGSVVYLKGALQKNLDKPVERVHKAALKGLKSIQVVVTDEKLEVHKSVIKGKFSDGASVTIEVDALTERASQITIRVGLIGDQTKAEMVLNAVERRL